jgi:hypothetical protein
MSGLPRGADHIDRMAGIPEDGLISPPKLPLTNKAQRHALPGPLGIARAQEASANVEALYSTGFPPQAGDEFTWPERAQ